ncbi:DNA primase large subunit, partial [Trichinella sp. T9]
LIAFSETFQDRQWFLQQEVDLFHFRILCERNASIRDFLSQNNITYESISEDEKEHQRKELFAGCHSAKVKYFKKMKKLPPEEEAIEQRRFVMQWEFYKIIAKRCHLLYADSRLADLRVLGDARCPIQEYLSSADSRSFTVEMVEP